MSSSDALKRGNSPVDSVATPLACNSPATFLRDLETRTSSASPSRKAMRQSPTLGRNMGPFRRMGLSLFACEKQGIAERFDVATNTRCPVSGNAHGRGSRGLGIGEFLHGWMPPRTALPFFAHGSIAPVLLQGESKQEGKSVLNVPKQRRA